MDNENMLKQFVHSYVYSPFLGTGFIFGLLLLFYKDFDSSFRNILVPAITVYMIGTLLVGYVYFELDVINCLRAKNKGEQAGPQPSYVTKLFWFIHIIWFLLLMIYLFCKSVL
jgi:hypothetical protein